MDYDFSDILSVLVPPPRRSASDWANEHGYLVGEGGTSTRWRPLKYQEEMLEAMSHGWGNASGEPIYHVVVKKSARVGYTKCLGMIVGRYIHEVPSRILIVQPTLEDCQTYAKEELAPMIDGTPCLQELISTETTNDGKSSMLHKTGAGFVLSIANAMTPRSFRMISRDLICCDEVDGFPLSSGKEGDPVKLAIRRADASNRRMIIEGSTPTNHLTSRISRSYETSDQRRFFVPCPHCHHKQYLQWKNFHWEKGKPASVVYICEKCGTGITPRYQRQIVEEGEWRPTNVGRPGVAGFHIWSAYSSAPNATWKHLAEEFDEVKLDPLGLQVFINTALGEVYEGENDIDIDAGDILSNLDTFTMGDIPDGVIILTAGVDVQGGGGSDRERIEISIWGWGNHHECWLINHVVIYGDPQLPEVWEQLDCFLQTKWPRKDKPPLRVRIAAIDSGGHSTQSVYDECKKRRSWVPIKGSSNIDAEEVRTQGIKVYRKAGAQKFKYQQFHLLGVNKIKDQIFVRLKKLISNEEEPYIHFPENLPPELAEQYTSEHRVVGTNGKLRWTAKGSIPSEAWDCLVYAWAGMRIIVRRYSPKTCWEQLNQEGIQVIETETKNEPQKPSYVSKRLSI